MLIFYAVIFCDGIHDKKNNRLTPKIPWRDPSNYSVECSPGFQYYTGWRWPHSRAERCSGPPDEPFGSRRDQCSICCCNHSTAALHETSRIKIPTRVSTCTHNSYLPRANVKLPFVPSHKIFKKKGNQQKKNLIGVFSLVSWNHDVLALDSYLFKIFHLPHVFSVNSNFSNF